MKIGVEINFPSWTFEMLIPINATTHRTWTIYFFNSTAILFVDQLGCNLFLRIFALGSIEINVGKWSIKAAVEVAQEADALNLPFLLPTLVTIIAIIAILTIVAIAIIVTKFSF